MRWKKGRRSSNIEDRRGRSVTRKVAGGGLGAVAITLVALFFGIDPQMLQQLTGGTQNETPTAQTRAGQSSHNDELTDFVSAILADTEDTWTPIFAQAGKQYRPPKLVLFSGETQSACGFAQSASGPFYCPADQKVYIDLVFYQQLRERFRAPGDFAQAYVIAHEVGHHVQTLLGISKQVQLSKRGLPQSAANQLQVRMELQADCFSGVWANHAHRHRQMLEKGDIEEGLTAAAAIGDDTIQKRSRGYVVPESFTHGSAEQRQKWFLTGLKSGQITACNTFAGVL